MRLIIALLLWFNISVAIAGEPENYCHDVSVNKDWALMLSKSPNDDAVAKLFALRLGLCELVERNIIKLDRATKIFEESREREIIEKLRAKRKEHSGV